MTMTQETRTVSRSVVIPLLGRAVAAFSRKDLEAYAKVEFFIRLPAGLSLPPKPEFTFAMAEHSNPGSPYTHVMRVQAQVLA